MKELLVIDQTASDIYSFNVYSGANKRVLFAG